MHEDIKKTILGKIKEYDRIVISRHVRPDGDAVGSSHGLAEIIRLSFPDKEVIVSNQDSSESLAFTQTVETDPETVDYRGALAIVLDTGNVERIANSRLGEARELIKIDHHIDNTPYGDISWVEEERSSVSEMVADFQYTFRDVLKCNLRAATLLYMGIITDSGQFKYAGTNGNTLRLAGYLLDMGIDLQMLNANLELEPFDYFKYQAYVFERMKTTANGVAYLHVDSEMHRRFNLSHHQASNSVEFMNNIKGSLIWIAFIDNQDGTTRVRLRSRFLAINSIAEKYGGGGHANASGATVHNPEEMQALLRDADDLLRKFKAENGGWL